MKTICILAAGLIVVGSLPVAAQRNDASRAERREAALDLRNDLRTWFEKDVYPSLKTWHDEYDASLSAEDRATLTTLRAEAKKLRAEMMAEMASMKGAARGGDRNGMRERMEEMRDEHRDAMENIIDRVKPIAKRSKDKLRAIFDANEDRIEEWRNEARAIVKAWRSEHPEMSGKGRGHRGPMGGPDGLPIIGEDGKRAALRFILWDGTMPPVGPENDMMGLGPQAGRQPLGPISITPAPSGNAATVRVTNVPNGPATLEIYDMNGTLVRTVNVTAANNTIETSVDISGLVRGSYMASVNTPNGRRTGQIIKE